MVCFRSQIMVPSAPEKAYKDCGSLIRMYLSRLHQYARQRIHLEKHSVLDGSTPIE